MLASLQEQYPQPHRSPEIAPAIDIATRLPLETAVTPNKRPYDWATENRVEITSRVVEPGETPQFERKESVVRRGAQMVNNALGLTPVPVEHGTPKNPAAGVAERVRETEKLRRSWH